jgi:N-acetylneuraminic acid mutarotase
MGMRKTLRLLRGASTLCFAVCALPAIGYAQSPGAQGTWTPKSLLSAARSEVVARAVNDRIYVLGGNSARTKYDLAINEEFDTATGQSRERAPLPTGGNHLGAVTLNNKIYVIGGFTKEGHKGATTNLYEYDPATDSWRTLAPLPVPRGSISAVVLDSKIHAFGGRNDTEMTALHDVYDPATNSWSAAPPMSKGRDHMAAFAYGGKIHVIGGRFGATADKTGLHEIYDPASKSWSVGPPMPTPRSGGTGIVFNDLLIVIGGEGAEGGGTFNQVEGYDPKSGKWVTLAPMPTGRHAFGLDAVGSTMYLFAGARGPGGREETSEVLAFTLQ